MRISREDQGYSIGVEETRGLLQPQIDDLKAENARLRDALDIIRTLPDRWCHASDCSNEAAQIARAALEPRS